MMCEKYCSCNENYVQVVVHFYATLNDQDEIFVHKWCIISILVIKIDVMIDVRLAFYENQMTYVV